jgi:hypothetical protein
MVGTFWTATLKKFNTTSERTHTSEEPWLDGSEEVVASALRGAVWADGLGSCCHSVPAGAHKVALGAESEGSNRFHE